MGFSGLMGALGGMARAGEQVIDQNIARLDAAGVARAKEAAQLRLEERTEKYVIAREGRTNARDDVVRTRGLMDDKTKIADALKAKHDATAYEQDPANIAARNAAANQELEGSIAGQQDLASKKSKTESERITAQSHADKVLADKAHYERADANDKAKNEAKADADPGGIKETAMAARVHAGVGTIDYVFGKGLDIAGRALNPNAIDNDQLYMATKAKYEDAVRKGELPLSASSRLVLDAIGGDKEKKKALEDYETKQKAIKDKHWWQSSDEKPATPKAESQNVAAIPKASLKGGEERGGYVWDAKLGRAVPVQPKADTGTAKAPGLMDQKKVDAPTQSNAPGGTPEPKPITTTLPKSGLTDKGASIESAYQALMKTNPSGKDYIKGLETFIKDPEFRNNHPEDIQNYKEYADEIAAFEARQDKVKHKNTSSKGSR